MINHERGKKDMIVNTTNETYLWLSDGTNIIKIYSWKFFYKRRQILYKICSGELLLYTVWFLLELILCGTNIQSQRQTVYTVTETDCIYSHRDRLYIQSQRQTVSSCLLLYII